MSEMKIRQTTLIEFKTDKEVLDLKEELGPDSKVKHIGIYAFAGNKHLKKVIIPDGILSIGYKAFSECENLEEIILPNSVNIIDNWAFNCCSKLKSVVLPEKLEKLAYGTFAHCESLESVTLPKKLRMIDSFAFDDCVKLNNVVLPDKLVSVKEFAFIRCESLVNVTPPNNDIYTFEFGAFKDTLYAKQLIFTNDGNVIHCDAEQRNVLERVELLSKLPETWFMDTTPGCNDAIEF